MKTIAAGAAAAVAVALAIFFAVRTYREYSRPSIMAPAGAASARTPAAAGAAGAAPPPSSFPSRMPMAARPPAMR